MFIIMLETSGAEQMDFETVMLNMTEDDRRSLLLTICGTITTSTVDQITTKKICARLVMFNMWSCLLLFSILTRGHNSGYWVYCQYF